MTKPIKLFSFCGDCGIRQPVNPLTGVSYAMKTLNFLPIAILAISPLTAFAHKVPYVDATCAVDEEQAAYEEIPLCTEEETEKSSATAYCKFMGHPALADCVEGVTRHGLAEAAGKCVEEAFAKQAEIKEQLVGHKVGGSGGADGAHWHMDYKFSKEDGWHRHDWSPASREKAGVEYGLFMIDAAKKKSEITGTTNESRTNWTVGGLFKTVFGVSKAAEVGIEANGNYGGGKTNTVERGPLSQEQLDKIFNDSKAQAMANPNLSNVNPDITCEKDKPKCSTSFSRDYANEDYKPQGGNKTGDNQSSGGSSGNTGSPSRGSQGEGNKNPTTPPSKSTTEVDVKIEHKPFGTFAGDPTPVTKPGEMLASYDQDALINSPISRCLMEELKEQVSKDMDKTYNPDESGLTPEQRRKEAQGLLRKGICSVKVYGPLYCQKYKMMKLTGTKAQDVPEEDKTDFFKELQELGKYNFGNPADFQDNTPIDFSRLPKNDPTIPKFRPIVVPKLN